MDSCKDDFAVLASSAEGGSSSGKAFPTHAHASPEVIDAPGDGEYQRGATDVEAIDESKKGRFAYFKTKEFYTVMLLGYVQLLDICRLQEY